MNIMNIITYNTFLRPIKIFKYDNQLERAHKIGLEFIYRFADNVDIIILNEVFDQNCKIILFQILTKVWQYHTKPTLDFFMDGGVYILSKQPFELERQHIFINSEYWDWFANKCVKYVKIGCFHIFATHLQASYKKRVAWKTQAAQIQECKKYISKQEINKRDIVLLGGDFNIYWDTFKYKYMLDQLNLQQFSTENRALKSLTSDNSVRKRLYKNSVDGVDGVDGLVDYIFVVKPSLCVKSLKLTSPNAFPDLSDHCPILGKLTYKSRNCNKNKKSNNTY